MLPDSARRRLLAAGQTVSLAVGQSIGRPGEPIRFVYFPLTACFSITSTLSDLQTLQVAMIGREGMWGVPIMLGMAHPAEAASVQGAGEAVRLPTAAFKAALRSQPALRRVIDRYVAVMLAQSSLSTACLNYHRLSLRLARWLLMTQDRAGMSVFSVTHESLAKGLGVRRGGVTQAAGRLQSAGLISYSRGKLSVLDRKGLKAAACACYGTQELAYRRTMKLDVANDSDPLTDRPAA
ncbi:Crp/Fnr family transcriptional regulator [soil metagenome]